MKLWVKIRKWCGSLSGIESFDVSIICKIFGLENSCDSYAKVMSTQDAFLSF
jgi:hypothetical protein